MLFIDLDETLIKSFPNKILEKADIVITENGIPYSVFLRPDYHLLKSHPFLIFTASLCSYAKKIYDFLKSKGLNVQGFMCREHLKPSSPKYPNVTGFLIDNNRAIATLKLRKLPAVKWVKIHPYDVKDNALQIIETKDGNSLKQAILLAETTGEIKPVKNNTNV